MKRAGGRIPEDVSTLFRLGRAGDWSDAQLLTKFVARDGEASELAFAVLMERHGPMVLRTCRRLLGDSPSVEDAFQAAFMVLLKRAGSFHESDSVGGWLHGVACRVSARIRADEARRRHHEAGWAVLGRSDQVSVGSSDVIQAVHEELARLPEKYRTPLVLCDLEGKTQAKAANEIGCPIGTVHSRLARGRERLRERLRRRGLDDSDGAIGSTLGAESARAALPAALKGKVAQAAARVAAGASPLGVVPTSVATLAQSLLKELMMANLKRAGSILLALSLAAGGVPVVAWQYQAAPSAAALSQALRAPDLAAAWGDSEKSAQAARAVRDPQRRVLALVQAAEAQSASGARDSAAATLREALGMAVALPVDTYAHATERWILMSDIGAAQARAGDFDAALLSVAEISKPIGPVENLKDNEKESPIDRIYEEIARTHAGSRRYLKAELAMSKLANGLQKDAVLAAIGDAKAEEGDWDGAERTISFVGFSETRVEAMGLLARSLFKAGRADEAKLLIAEAVRTAEAAGGGPDGRAAALYRAVLAQAEVDGPEAALQTAERIPGGWLDDLRFYWPWPFRQRAFVELRARVGDFAQAKASAREIPEAYEGGGGRGFQRGLAFRDIARAQASAHDFEAALGTTAEITDPVGKAGAFIDIASARARAGGRVGVSETFRKGLVVMQAMPEAKGNVRFDKRPPLFKELARVQAEAGDEGVAEGWIGALDSPELKAWALAGLAEGMARRKTTPK